MPVKQQSLVLAIPLLLSLIGCGGSNNSDGTAPPITEPETGTINGHIVLEERAGKISFDAWFSKGSDSNVGILSTENTHIDWSDDFDRCSVSTVSDDLNALARTASATTDAVPPQTYSAGESITVTSRAGTYIEAKQQNVGHYIVYATEQRWLGSPVPDDATLSIQGGTAFPALLNQPFTPIESLQRESPENGILLSPTAPIEWLASSNGSAKIRMLLSAVNTQSTSGTLTEITCELTDDGNFTLPEGLVDVIPSEETEIVVYLSRVSIDRFAVGDSVLLLTQRSNAAGI